MNSLSNRLLDYIKGFIDIVNIETPRYSFFIKKIDITYPNGQMLSQATYLPVGCHREYTGKISELNTKNVCYKFKPEHARIIVGISTLEHCLDLTQKDHAQIYLSFIETCSSILKNPSEYNDHKE